MRLHSEWKVKTLPLLHCKLHAIASEFNYIYDIIFLLEWNEVGALKTSEEGTFDCGRNIDTRRVDIKMEYRNIYYYNLWVASEVLTCFAFENTGALALRGIAGICGHLSLPIWVNFSTEQRTRLFIEFEFCLHNRLGRWTNGRI